MRAMFAPVRARSLKLLFCSVFVRVSERKRTRANAEPCHSCHASLVDELAQPRRLHQALLGAALERARERFPGRQFRLEAAALHSSRSTPAGAVVVGRAVHTFRFTRPRAVCTRG